MYPAASFGSLLEDVTGSFILAFDKSAAENNGGSTETADTANYQVNDQKSLNAGFFNGTSADRNDNSGILGIGYRNKTIGTQLVGYFRLDNSSVSGTGGSVQDYSGEDRAATATNGVTTDYPGVFSTNAYDFDGTDDRVDLPQNFGIFDGSSNYTISTWFNADQVAPGSDYQTSPVILSFNSERDIFLTFGDSYSGDTLGLRVQGQSNGWFTPVLYDGINTDQWYHVTVTYNTVNGYKFYLNGEEKDSNPTTDPPASASASSMIGGFGDSQSNRFFNGTVDEVRIFDTSLSASEVRRFHFNTSTDKYFEGNYTSEKIDTSEDQSWDKLYVDSEVPVIDDSFTVDTGSEWNDEGTINNGLNVSGSNLELKASDITYSEKFNESYSDTVNGVAVDSDGNVYAAGDNNNVVKLDSSGQEQWSYNYGDWINDVAVDSDGNVYAAGDSFGPDSDNIVKLDSSGNLIWSYDVGGDSIGLDIDSEGNVYAASDDDDVVVKLDSDGVEQWTYSYDDLIASEPAVDSDGNVYFGGNAELVKLNSNGGEELRDSGYDPAAIDFGPEGNIYISEGDRIKKLNQSRNEIWDYYTGTDFVELKTDSNGDIYGADNDVTNPKLLKLDSGGNKVWSYTTSEPVPTVGVSGSTVAFGTGHNIISLYDPEYSDSGDYISNVFDAGSVSSFSNFETSSSLSSVTNANVTVSLSNSSDMTDSVSEQLELGGGTESEVLDAEAQYAQYTVNMSGEDSDTPELDRVNIDYSAEATSASAVFRALDSSENIEDSQVIDLSTESTNHSLDVSNSENAEVVFKGTSTKPSKSWEIKEFIIYYSGTSGGGTSSTKWSKFG